MPDTAPSVAAQPAILPCPSCGRLNRVDLARRDAAPSCGACRAAIPLDAPLHATDATFPRIVQEASVPVIVDFYADWCAPCRMMAPFFDEVARRRAGRAVVLKVDTDRAQEVAMRHGIRSIPTLIVFQGGREVARRVGVQRPEAMEALLDGAA